MVSNEIPQDTGAAFQESQSAAQVVTDNALLVGNLEPLDFLISMGKVTNIEDASNLKIRPEDISFLRLSYVVDGVAIDNRVTKFNLLSFQFCPEMLQYIYDVEENTVTPVVNAKMTPAASTVATPLTCLFHNASIPPSSPKIVENSTLESTPPPPSINVISSPEIKLFSASTSISKSNKKDYYVSMISFG